MSRIDKHGPHILTLVTGPIISPVSLATLKAHLRIDEATEDDILQMYLDAATAVAQEQLGKALISQTWNESVRYVNGRVDLTVNHVQSLSSITYYDSDNVQQTATLSDFDLVAGDDWAYVESDAWPSLYSRADAITFQYVAGFGSSPDSIPANIRQAILLLAGQYYANRENVSEAKLTELPQAFTALIGLSRTGWYG